MKEYKRGLSDVDFKRGLDLLIRKVEVNDLDWQDIVEELEMDIHRDVLRKAFQSPFGGYAIYKYLEENKINNSNDDIIKEYNEKIKELEIAKIQFQDQKREYRNILRADAKLKHIHNTIKEEIHKVNRNNPLNYGETEKIQGNNHAVLLLSDWHIGLEVDNHWNKFNIGVAQNRIQELLNKTITYCKRHEVNTIHLELLGDLINGIIHLTTRISNEEDVIRQVMITSEILSNFINELSKHIENVKVYSTIGNHGRVSANIKESLDVENFEKLIPWYCSARIDKGNVEFIESDIDDSILVYKFLNETIFSIHGNHDKLTSVVNDLSKMLRIFPTSVHLGHLHHHYEKEEYDMEVVVNGSLSGTDDYAKNIRKSGRPMQKLMIYNAEGKECTYKIKL